MHTNEKEEATIYKVVVNHEAQYSIWPAAKENPPGWNDTGRSGRKAECLAYIEEVWTDMRPLSVRKRMAEIAQQAERKKAPSRKSAARKSLVQRLCEGEHQVEINPGAEKTAQAFKKRIDLGYVYLKFVNTNGGTELGLELDRYATDLSDADFDRQTGKAHLAGNLILDFVPVKCIADIDLKTLAGKARVVKVEK